MVSARFKVALTTIIPFLQVVNCYKIILSSNGPVVLGGTITFRADLYGSDGTRPSGTFSYTWDDDALISHHYQTEATSNTTTFYSVSYPQDQYNIGFYKMQVKASRKSFWYWTTIDSERIEFRVTDLLNGNITIIQSNKTLQNDFVSSASESNITINMREGDEKFALSEQNTVATYWFVDCKYYGVSGDLNFAYNFTVPNISHLIEALVVISKKPPLPPTTTTMAPAPSNTTTTTTPKTSAMTVSPIPSTTVIPPLNSTILEKLLGSGNITGETCVNISVIAPDPDKVYGLFRRVIVTKAPITDINAKGTNWIQPWDMLNLNISCKGTGPFSKCLQFYNGKYNVTGNETCGRDKDTLDDCKFSITRWFLEPSVYTILVILDNAIGKEIYPLTINIYKVTKQPQLSVIVVPVTCSLVAVVLIIFGVSYYIQSRSRFTVEVANFDFGKSNPDMDYKTFMERLRDSIKNPGNESISGYERLGNPEVVQ